MQAAGRQQARSRRGRMCPQQAEAWLLIDTLTATDCASRRRGGKPGWLQKGKQWKPLCTRVLWFYASRVRTSVQLVRRGVNVPQRAGVVQQLLRVHPSDLTYNSTNYLTTSITFSPPLSCVQFTFPAFGVISWSPKETRSEWTSHVFPHHSPTCQYYMYFFPLSKHHA